MIKIFKKFPTYKQKNLNDCGIACILIILKYFNIKEFYTNLENRGMVYNKGLSLFNVKKILEDYGFYVRIIRVKEIVLLKEYLPFITLVENHYSVVYKLDDSHVYISEPKTGKRIKLVLNEIIKKDIICVLVNRKSLIKKEKNYLFKHINNSVFKNKFLFINLIIGFLIINLFSVLLPIIVQYSVDFSINNGSYNYLFIFFIANITFFIIKTSVELNRYWISFFLNKKIETDIYVKNLYDIIGLKVSFFKKYTLGDIIQRIKDSEKINTFIVNNVFSFIFSISNIFIQFIFLSKYDYKIALFTFTFSIVYILWISFFFKKRKEIDYMKFSTNTKENNFLIDSILGIKDIKVFQSENHRAKKANIILYEKFNIGKKSLMIDQFQSTGSSLITYLGSNIIIYYCIYLIINKNITIGSLFSIQIIIAQIISSLSQILFFTQSFQDVKNSISRLEQTFENSESKRFLSFDKNENMININQLCYKSIDSKNILEKINIDFLAGKLNVIVGKSGSGKSTLLNCIIQDIEDYEGNIYLGSKNIKEYSLNSLRNKISVVAQDSYLFKDSYLNNITMGHELDEKKLKHVLKIVNMYNHVNEKSNGYETIIENNISGGEKQRILIARGLYKESEILILDEITSAVDGLNEKNIMSQLKKIDKTIIMVSHKLNTIINADKIVVIDEGNVCGTGNHKYLMENNVVYKDIFSTLN